MDFAEIVRRPGQKDADGSSKKTFKDVRQWEKALSVKAVDVEKRQIRILASNADLDRDNERISPEAFKNSLDIFKSNPVILAAHQHRLDDGSPSVVGRAVDVWVDNTGLWCIIEFAKTRLAEEYWLLYSGGFMKAVSIGFAPLAWSDTNENGKGVRIFTEVELFEISLVAVGSNRAALSKHQRGKIDWLTDKKILDEIKKQNPDFEKSSNEFAELLLGDNKDSETAETDEPDCGEESSGSRFELAKAVNPQGNYEENELVRLVTRQ
ncbi:MAG: HK97 family phage prohead protease [Sedimentisphaerales bacterium]